MLPFHPVKLQNQDKLLHCTSRDSLSSTVSYVELYQIKTEARIFLCQSVAFTKLLLSQLPCHRCPCCIAPTLALDVVIVATPLVNCCVAATLAIINLGCRCFDLMFRPFRLHPCYNGSRHEPWAIAIVFSGLFCLIPHGLNNHTSFYVWRDHIFIRKFVPSTGRISRDAEKALPDIIYFWQHGYI